MKPHAVILNMFYTGVGIARSLAAENVPVIGLTAVGKIYGNYTRCAQVRRCPDSREQPSALLEFLQKLGHELGPGSVLFPTRDDDVLFLDRHRETLERHFSLVIPPPHAVRICLDKWETYRAAQEADVPSPRCWIVENEADLLRAGSEIRFPCVMKPVSAHLWRQQGNWQIVGARKALAATSLAQLQAEYQRISNANPRALLQELVPGGDDHLFVAGCYVDRSGAVAAVFTAQKLLQSPALFGTGCIVQTVDRPDVAAAATRLLQSITFHGIAEVEFKVDAGTGDLKLIEINPRPWDQHILGRACGVDVIYAAYAEHAGMTAPRFHRRTEQVRWIAEDALIMAALRSLWSRSSSLNSLLRQSRGVRTYAIWDSNDKWPFICYSRTFVAALLKQIVTAAARPLTVRLRGRGGRAEAVPYGEDFERADTQG